MRSLLLFSLFVLSYEAGFSQTHEPLRFSPLPDDGYWEYELHDHSYGENPPYVYASIEVMGDTVINDIPYTLLLDRRLNSEASEISRATCAVRLDETGKWRHIGIQSSDGSCHFPVEFLYLSQITAYAPKQNLDQEIEIGGQKYAIATTSYLLYMRWGTGGSGGSHSRLYAEGIGQLSSRLSWTNHSQAGGGGGHRDHRLVYARVEGRVYGTTVVSTADNPRPPQEVSAVRTIYPNPFRDEVRISFDTSTAAPVAYAVYDIMGRRVLTGFIPAGSTEATVAFDLGPAGIYFIEFLGEGVRREVHRLVRFPADSR